MPHEPETKLKLPRTLGDIQTMEDQLQEVSQILREMRRKMKEKSLETVELMTGTFNLYAKKLKDFAEDFDTQLDRQIRDKIAADAKKAAKATRAQFKSGEMKLKKRKQ